MVLEHQAHFSNLVTRATWEAQARARRCASPKPPTTLADYMLFVDEAKIADGPIEGSSGFAEEFIARGAEGRRRAARCASSI